MAKGYSSRELRRLVEQAGWTLHRLKGSHHIYKHPERVGLVIVPHPKKNIPTGTARSILRAAGIE